MNDYLTQISNKIAASISKQKDNLIYQVLKENNIDTSDLTELVKTCSFVEHTDWSGIITHRTLRYNGRDLLIIYEPDIKCENDKISCEVKYKKLY